MISGFSLQLIKQEWKAGKNILSRLLGFFTCVVLFQWLRSQYTWNVFHFELVLQDGYLQYALFALTALFVWAYWPTLKSLTFKSEMFTRTAFLGLAIACLVFPIRHYETYQGTHLLLLEYGVRGLGEFFLFLAWFGLRFFKTFWLTISTFAFMLILLMLSSLLVDSYWPVLSRFTMVGLRQLFEIFQIPYYMRTDIFSVTVRDFQVNIGAPCAGVYSLVAFAVLYAFGVLVTSQQRKKTSVWRVAAFFLVGGIITFFLNSLRVLLIILVGAYYSPELAVHLFHDYIGAALFLVFFLFYSRSVFKRLET